MVSILSIAICLQEPGENELIVLQRIFFSEFSRRYSRNDWTAWDSFIGHLLDFGMEKNDLGRYVQIIARKGALMGLGMRIFIVKDDGSLNECQ